MKSTVLPSLSPRTARQAWLLLAAVTVCLGPVRAAPNNTSNTVITLQSPPTNDQNVANSSYYTNSGTYHGEFDRNPFQIQGDEFAHRHAPRPVYFPPDPPALGEPLKRREPVALGRFAPPAALAGYVFESFYAPLSTLLFTEDLSRKRRDRLEAYRTDRAALLTELRSRLETLRTADAATREHELAALAGAQSARLAALEAAAEELRFNFTHGGFFETSVDWDDAREWRLGDNPRSESPIAEIEVLRAAAAFQDGLSAAQRRLAREIAMELVDSLHDPTAEVSLGSPGPFLYFSPATARIRLPADLPAALTARIDAYTHAKAVLKAELREALNAQDRAWFGHQRVNSFKALAEKQAAPLAALDAQAEEIRRELAAYPNPAQPPALPLPPSLTARIHTFNQAKVALQNRLIAKLEETKTALPDDRVEYIRSSGAYVLEITPNPKSSAAQNARREAILATLPAFNDEAARSYTQLARETKSIRADVLQAVDALPAKPLSKGIDQLLKEFAFAFQKQETWEMYRDYETAVLEPGLSPAQRVILFGAALEKLDLPLAN